MTKTWTAMKKIMTVLWVVFLCYSCRAERAESDFVFVKDAQFYKNGKPYYYIGTNFWYGAILGSQGEVGDRTRLHRELDSLKSLGIENLRILVGADGQDGVLARVEPTLQKSPGVYNDEMLDGLDYLLSEMRARDMSAVLYINNSWEWSGGYGQYLEWAGYGKAPVPAADGWAAFGAYVSQYIASDSAKMLFSRHVDFIVSRKNRYTGDHYADDPTIMAWQIGNEPRPFGKDNKIAFALWINDVARQIRSLDPNHLISVGSEGTAGCEGDIQLWELIHACSDIGYLTIHIWPYNWGWVDKDDLTGTIDNSIEKTVGYIEEHLAISQKLDKPMVIEEFGFIRDEFRFETETPVTYRDRYLETIFAEVVRHSEIGGLLAGCNFWAWGGFAKQNTDHVFWQKGDDYMGDPAQEQQGLYSVFYSDTTTIDLIREYNLRQLN